ncbi:type II toxin-antitoxin system HipA family toxin [Flavobacterium sp. MXW15]|uniref:Type II toxin-antitoxin system HipA family toxin n=1 Tax=Xanthomonas chitinilytica TaxID=2989819 RepID=A0ABT3JZS6_9XANT|nr:type II toxin-antitoxin system HipA family toxin [Xanthomonas sp. H13-6]MCW4456137.1 type II toxin-antitoxin system HipA family toxin [Flavobacterium sp. MXW15]MCW4473734.1 type II toxin-antitoxin system HipA family toxin [Xanthomonas sp. H13-6]
MAELQVWMNGVEVASWEEGPHTTSRLTYLPSWLESPLPRPLSLSLPLLPAGESHRGQVVADYFDNLLPDNDSIRNRIRDRFGTRSTGTFDLLQAIGRDCVGAVQLLPKGVVPDDVHSIRYRALTDAEVADLLRGVTATPMPGTTARRTEEFRISIAGAQEKTGLLRHRGQWCIPAGSTPSTHIFKLPLGLVGNMRADMHQSVENEWLCMQLLGAFGIPVANTSMGRFEDQRALIVERFDRRLARDGRWWLRLPQEDMCQVFGLPASKKYESDGGPGIVRIMELLRQSERTEDRAIFFKTQLLFWMLAATDGHAKNFSLHIEPAGRFRLTPIYDVLSVYPILGRGPQQLSPFSAQLAMSVLGKNRHRRLQRIRRRHWNETARICGIAAGAEPWIGELLDKVEPAIASVQPTLPPDFPDHVAESIFTGLRRARDRIAAMPVDA